MCVLNVWKILLIKTQIRMHMYAFTYVCVCACVCVCMCVCVCKYERPKYSEDFILSWIIHKRQKFRFLH